jgi:hypothetical protein
MEDRNQISEGDSPIILKVIGDKLIAEHVFSTLSTEGYRWHD